MSPEIEAAIQTIATAIPLPADLLKGQVLRESGGDPYAFRFEPVYFQKYIKTNNNAKGFRYGPLAACSFGLLQCLLETAIEAGFTGTPEELFNPATGLTWGGKIMRGLWAAAGGLNSNYRAALAAYNGGATLLHLPESSWPVAVRGYVDGVYALARPTTAELGQKV